MKKYLALILTLVLALTAVIPAFAAPPVDNSKGTGTAGVEFDAEGPGIDPDPDPDGDGSWEAYKLIGLDFGIHDLVEVYGTVQKYDSREWAGRRVAKSDGGTKEPGKEGAMETIGIAIRNGLDEGYKVTVEIDGFKVVGSSTPTMSGYTLDLIVDETKGTSSGTPTYTNKIELSAGASRDAIVAAPGEGKGTFGAVYHGEIEIPANTTHAGEAQATMTWTVAVVPPVGG